MRNRMAHGYFDINLDTVWETVQTSLPDLEEKLQKIDMQRMALNIRSPETEALAAELARLTGETKTEAVTKAVRDRLERVKRGRHRRSLADELDTIGKQCAALPVLDPREPDEILGYDEHGLPR
jgi:antitoxin VapB